MAARTASRSTRTAARRERSRRSDLARPTSSRPRARRRRRKGPGPFPRRRFPCTFPGVMLRSVTDRYLPPDHAAFLAAEPPTGRVIVIAPTRAACETIELAIGLRIATFLDEHHGDEVRRLAREGKGFGIVAGTGTGKTLGIRLMAEEILRTTELKVGVVNRERE